ncbi:hypothetical protein MMC29_006898 [Sticta canariensis]|nr:hypothetical protein [Sticta canariensis]
MSPINGMILVPRASNGTKAAMDPSDRVLEAWGEGFNLGALVILILLLFCNYRVGVLLHKLILLERSYLRYLSATAALLFISYQLHNVVAWIKIKRFLPSWGGKFYIYTLIAVQPFWIAELYLNFEYFNGLGNLKTKDTRPWEALARNVGINPYWRFALVFKCASDTILLDDFKTVLDAITAKSIDKAGGHVHRGVAAKPPSSGDISSHNVDGLGHGNTVTIHSEPPLRDFRKKWRAKRFARHDNDNDNDNGSDEMKIQRDTTVTVSNLNPQNNRSGSFGSGERILPRPETAASRHLHGPWALNLPAGNRTKIPEL